VVAGQRKGYSAWSRKVQFAAVRPVKRSYAELGLALPSDAGARLTAAKKESWSERLTSSLTLNSPEEVDVSVCGLLELAWAAS